MQILKAIIFVKTSLNTYNVLSFKYTTYSRSYATKTKQTGFKLNTMGTLAYKLTGKCYSVMQVVRGFSLEVALKDSPM